MHHELELHRKTEEETGVKVIVSEVTPEDYEDISAMITQNFQISPSYTDLEDDARRSYIEANTSEGVRKNCTRDGTICALVVRDNQNSVVGHHVVRVVQHRVSGQRVAGVRRLHVAQGFEGSGLGKSLMEISEELARNIGFDRMVVNASGESHGFFSRIGYTEVGVLQNRTFSSQGVQTSLVYMEKTL